MVRIKSEIAEDFEKLLVDAGMSKEAYSSLDAYKDDAEARAGSDDISTIEALYGVKPETIPGMDYKDCIMESAHKESVIIAPSYDKLNGLVENNIERHNIMSNLALKPNEGNHSNPKYAKQELVMELVRLANEMDNKHKEDLFKLADDCLIDLHKQALSMGEFEQWVKKKTRDTGAVGEGALAGAGIGAAIGGLVTAWTGAGVLAGVPVGAATGAVAGGLIAAFTKTAPQVKNIEENAHEVSKQLQDLYKITEQVPFFDKINKALQNLITSSQKYQSVLHSIHEHSMQGKTDEPRAVEETEHHDAEEAAKAFLKDVDTIKKFHAEFDRLAKSGAFAKENPAKVLAPIYWFMDDNIEDVSDAFDSLEDAINKLELSTKEEVSTAHSEAPAASKSKAPAVSTPEGLDEEGFLSHISKFF